MEQLTEEQIIFAMKQFTKWLEIKEAFEMVNSSEPRPRWGYMQLTKINMDILHSALLFRLLSGSYPLTEPPPLKHGYPDYARGEKIQGSKEES